MRGEHSEGSKMLVFFSFGGSVRFREEANPGSDESVLVQIRDIQMSLNLDGDGLKKSFLEGRTKFPLQQAAASLAQSSC
jgi:hypothetical protein